MRLVWTKKFLKYTVLAPFLPALAESLACVQSHQWGGSWHPLQLQVFKWNLTDQKIQKGGPQGRGTMRQKSPFGPKVVSKLSQSCYKIVSKLSQCNVWSNFPKASQSFSFEITCEIWGLVLVGPQVKVIGGGGVPSIGWFGNLKFKNRLDEDLNPQPCAMSCCCWLCLALFWNFLSTHHRQQVSKLYR